MNQQRFASLDNTTMDEEDDNEDDEFVDGDEGDISGGVATPQVEQSVDDEVMSDS